MQNDPKSSSTNTSNPSLSGVSTSGASQKGVGGNNAVDWLKKKTGTALKKVNRLEEKFNQAIGKAQRTEDELFKENLKSFEEQSQSAALFYKELNKYIVGLRETQKNQKGFFECLKQVYEPSWPGYNDLIQQCQKQEDLWTHHIDLLQQCIQVPINQYLKEFPEYKKQIEKRDNKLLDYDKARHSLHDLEGAKKPDEIRIHRARADLHEKQKLFNDLNAELHSNLPNLYEERKCVYSKTFKSLFNIEKSFYNNMFESKQILNNVCEKLIEEFNCNDDEYKPISNGNGETSNNNNEYRENVSGPTADDDGQQDDDDKPSAYEFAVDTLNNSRQQSNTPTTQSKKTDVNDVDTKPQQHVKPTLSSSSSTSSINSPTSQTKSPIVSSVTTQLNVESTTYASPSKPVETLYSNLLNEAVNKNLFPAENESKVQKVLYRVKATYPYQSKEVDELTFNKEDLIDVIEGTESEKEDLDEGWQIGIHCQTNSRGLFPENFTKRV